MLSALSAAQLAVLFKGDVTGLQQVLAQAESGIDRFGNRTSSTLRSVNKEAKDTGLTMDRLANGIKGAFVGGSVAVGLITLKNHVVAATGALVDAQVQVDRLRNGFKFGAGSAEGGARELAFVREEAKRLGLEINGTANQYMKMVAASRGNSLAGAQTREVFKSIAEATVVMGMGADQSERSFMAVTQMMSKGKVMAEELRGQLGEHLPGAFSIAARAMGVTEVELNKMLETGQVFSADFLPKFAAQLRKELAGSVEESSLAMQASLNRMSTAWTVFKQEVVQSGIGGAVNNGVKAITNDLTFLGETLEVSRQRGDGFWMTMANTSGAAIGRATFGAIEQSAEFLNGTINLLSGGFINLSTNIDLMPANLKPASAAMVENAEKVRQAKAEYDFLAARLAMAPDNIYIKSDMANLANYIARLQEAQAEQRRLLGGMGAAGPVGAVPSGDTELARAKRAEYDKQVAARSALLKQYATPKERLSEELDKQRKLLGDLFTPELEKRISEHFIKPSKAAAREAEKARKAFGELYNKLTMKDVGLDPDFYEDLNTLHKGYQAGKITLEEYRGAVEALITTQKFAKDAADAALKANIAAGESNNAAFDEVFNTREKERLSVEERIKAGREMLEDLQFETQLLGMNAEQREVAIAMRELERKGVVAGTEAYKAYADQIQRAIADKQQTQKMVDMWSDFEGAARDVFMDIAENGSDAFKRIGQSIKREVLQMLYEMTVKKWIIQVAGSYGGGIGGGGGTNWIDMASQAYSYYTGGAAGAASTYSLASGASGGTGLSAGAAGTGLRAGGGTGLSYTATTSTSAGSGAAAGGSTSLAAYAGYAALIWAAVQYADKLYGEGYNRNMLGKGQSQRYTWGYGNRTSGYTDNAGYDGSLENFQRKLMDGLGMSEKWADILSGTTRYAHMFGRKLNSYGYAVDINGGDVSVGGYERYRAGWAGRMMGRKSKEMPVAIDARNAEMVRQEVESIRNGAKGLAAAMGLSSEAIDGYTGKLKINFKGANTAAEQAERMAEAMDDLQFSMLKAASGGKLARAEFDRMMEGVRADIEAAGISTGGITSIFKEGILNGSSGEEIGAALSANIMGGIYGQLVQNAFAPVAQSIMAQIITPMFAAMAAGIPLSQAINKAAIQNAVQMANNAAAVLKELFNNEEFRAAMAEMNAAFTSMGGAAAGIKLPSFKPIATKPVDTTVADTAREREQLERELLRLQGNTVELRRRELLDLKPSNRALQERIWKLEDEQEAAEKLKDTWSSVIDAMTDEVRRLRDEILGTGPAAQAATMAQFVSSTAAARAGDSAAAERLPELGRLLVEMAQNTSASLSDLRSVQGFVMSSLNETRTMLASGYGIELPKLATGTNYVPRDMVAMLHEGEAVVPRAYNPAAAGGSDAVVAELRALRSEMQREISQLKAVQVAQAAALGRLERMFDSVTVGGAYVRSKEVAA